MLRPLTKGVFPMKSSFAVLFLVSVAVAWSPTGALAGGAAEPHAEAAHASAVIGADGFLSPDRATWCSASAKEVGCVSLSGTDAHGAIVSRGGKVILCPVGSAGRGWDCFQNFDEKAPVLHYGSRAEFGAFGCASTRRGITCTVRASGRGFRIDRGGVVAVR
jgi:hypothetical protein